MLSHPCMIIVVITDITEDSKAKLRKTQAREAK